MSQADQIAALQTMCGHDPKKMSATAQAINWAALLALFQQLLPAILPIILPFLGPTPPVPAKP